MALRQIGIHFASHAWSGKIGALGGKIVSFAATPKYDVAEAQGIVSPSSATDKKGFSRLFGKGGLKVAEDVDQRRLSNSETSYENLFSLPSVSAVAAKSFVKPLFCAGASGRSP